MFKVSLASLQTFIDTTNCVLEDRVQYSMVYTSVSQTFFKWEPLLFVRMFYGPPYSCPLRKQIV
jgi:hypothetical protein